MPGPNGGAKLDITERQTAPAGSLAASTSSTYAAEYAKLPLNLYRRIWTHFLLGHHSNGSKYWFLLSEKVKRVRHVFMITQARRRTAAAGLKNFFLGIVNLIFPNVYIYISHCTILQEEKMAFSSKPFHLRRVKNRQKSSKNQLFSTRNKNENLARRHCNSLIRPRFRVRTWSRACFFACLVSADFQSLKLTQNCHMVLYMFVVKKNLSRP